MRIARLAPTILLASSSIACAGRAAEPAAPAIERPREVAPSDEAPFATEPAAVDPACRGAAPSPDEGTIEHASDAGIVRRVPRVVPGTERHRAPTYTHCFYLQADPEAAPRAVLSERSTRASGVVGVVRGDTLVLFETGAEPHVLLVRAPSESREGTVSRFRARIAGEEADPIAAWDDGVLMQARRLNESAPLFFVPWSERGIAIERRVELTGPEGAPYPQETVCRSGDRIVWASTRLHVFDLATRARRDHDIGAVASWMPRLAACDDDVALFRGATIGGEPTRPAFVIATGAPLPARFAEDAIAVRHRFAYVVRAAPTSRVSYDLVRYDLEADGRSEVVAQGLASGRPAIALRSGLYVREPAGWRRIEWTPRAP